MDSPGWFGPKAYGFGLGPKTWQGWLAIIIYAVLMIAIAKSKYFSLGLKLGALAIVTATLGLVVYFTYRPR